MKHIESKIDTVREKEEGGANMSIEAPGVLEVVQARETGTGVVMSAGHIIELDRDL